MTDHKDLLKQLVEAPYGKAQDILRSKGLWDEKKCSGDPDQIKTYKVRVDGYMDVSALVTVEATSEEEACDKAIEIAGDASFAWSIYGDTDVWNAEVESRS